MTICRVVAWQNPRGGYEAGRFDLILTVMIVTPMEELATTGGVVMTIGLADRQCSSSAYEIAISGDLGMGLRLKARSGHQPEMPSVKFFKIFLRLPGGQEKSFSQEKPTLTPVMLPLMVASGCTGLVTPMGLLVHLSGSFGGPTNG